MHTVLGIRVGVPHLDCLTWEGFDIGRGFDNGGELMRGDQGSVAPGGGM